MRDSEYVIVGTRTGNDAINQVATSTVHYQDAEVCVYLSP